MAEQRCPTLLADAPRIVETPDSEDFGVYLLRRQLPQAQATEEDSALTSAAQRALLSRVGAVQQQLSDISSQVAALVKEGSGSTQKEEAQAARLVELLDRALLALDDVRMPGEGPTPAAVRTARRAAADRALGLAEQLEVSGKSRGRQSMKSVRSQRLRSIIRGAPNGSGFGVRQTDIRNSISDSLQDRLDASPAGPWDAASFGLAQEVEQQLMRAVSQREEELRALSQQAETLMAVNSVGKAEQEQTAWLLEAVDRVLLSIDEVQAPEGLPMPSGVRAARQGLADDALALATRLEGYLGYSAYSSLCTDESGSDEDNSSREPPSKPPPQQTQQAVQQRDQQPPDGVPSDDLHEAGPSFEDQLYLDPDGDVQAQVNAWMDDHEPSSPLPPLLIQAFAKSGRSMTATKVVPALLAAGGAAGIQQLGPGSRLCVWETSAAAGDGSWKQSAAPLHLAPLLVRYKGLCKWSIANFGLSLPPAAADGHDIVAALRSGVATAAAEAAPKCIVFVEDDWQPEAGGEMSEVIALWRDLTCSGPRNVVWVLAPRRPLSAWIAMTGSSQAAVDSTFADRVIVLPLVSRLNTGERQAMWKALCSDIARQGKEAPADELLTAAQAAEVGPAMLDTLAQAWPLAPAAWHADAEAFVKDSIKRLAIAVGHDWEYVRESLDDGGRATLQKMITTGATAPEAERLPYILQTFLQHWEAPSMQGLRAVDLGFSAKLVEAAMSKAATSPTLSEDEASDPQHQTSAEHSPIANSLQSSDGSATPDFLQQGTASTSTEPVSQDPAEDSITTQSSGSQSAPVDVRRQRVPITRRIGRGRPMIPAVRVQLGAVPTAGPALPTVRAEVEAEGGRGPARGRRGQPRGNQASSSADRPPSDSGSGRRPSVAAQVSCGRTHVAATVTNPNRVCDRAASGRYSDSPLASDSDCCSDSSTSSSLHSSSSRSRGSSKKASGRYGSAYNGPAHNSVAQLQRGRDQWQRHSMQPDSEGTFVTALETASGADDIDYQTGPHSRERIDSDKVLFGSGRRR